MLRPTALLPRLILVLLICLQALAPLLHAHTDGVYRAGGPSGLHVHLLLPGQPPADDDPGLSVAHAREPLDAAVEAAAGVRPDKRKFVTTPADAPPDGLPTGSMTVADAATPEFHPAARAPLPPAPGPHPYRPPGQAPPTA